MKVSLTPYPSYKFVGTPWLGDVPAHWEVRRLKQAGRLVAGAGFPVPLQGVQNEEFPFFKVSDLAKSVDGRWLSYSDSTISRQTAASLRAQVIPKGAIAYAKIGEALRLNRRRIIARPSCIDNNMTAFVPNSAALTIEWALHSLSILDFGKHVNPGAVPSLSEGDQAILSIPLPPIPEQRAIVRYLDYVGRRIRRYITAKQKLIDLLEEEKQAIINQAVTRGLDPDVRLKPSGVEWLGDVPEHWEAVQLGRKGIFSKGTGGTKEDEVPEGIPCVRYGDLYTTHKYFISETRSYVSSQKATAYTPIERGDVLFPTSGETIEEIGKSAVNLMSPPVVCGGDLIIFRPKIPIDHKYAGYALDCSSAQTQKSLMGRGITIMHIYSAQLKYLWIPAPPLHEQQAIAQYVDQEIAGTNAAIARARRQIELVEEYRTRLIADVVTGKLDVREAAAQLPDEAVDDDPID